MATSETGSVTMSGKADDFRHSCGLCMEPYNKGRIPKLLPCFHSFCVSCLTAVVANAAKPDDSVQEKTKTAGTEPVECSLQGGEANEDNLLDPAENEDAANKDSVEKKEKEDVEGDRDGKQDVAGDGEHGVVGSHGDVFLCPSCRAPVNVPAGGVAALQYEYCEVTLTELCRKTFVVENDVKHQIKKERQLCRKKNQMTNFYLDLDFNLNLAPTAWCEICEDGQRSEATHFCNNCQQRMCRSCRRLHDRVAGAREHRVEPITGGSAAKSVKLTEGKKSCQYHPDQLLCFHCQKCDVSICLHCKLTSHEGHSTEDMATAAIRAKEELTGVLTKANKQLRVVDASLSRLERDALDLTRQKQEVTRQLKANYDVIMAWVTRASEEARETLEAKEQTALNEIHSEQASAHNVKETISGLVSRAMASRKASLGPDLVLLKNELQAALLSDDAFDHYEKLGSRKLPRTFFECRADPSALDLDLVRVYLGELLEEGDAGTQDSALSFRDLGTLVPKLEAEIKALEAEMKALNDKGQVEKVSFHALLTSSPTYTNGQNIVFNQVWCNQGNGYSNATGIFTAPVPGSYMFMMTVKPGSGDGHVVYANLCVNGSVFAYIASRYSYTAHCVAELKKGEQVCVQAGSDFACQATYTMFSGALVSK